MLFTIQFGTPISSYQMSTSSKSDSDDSIFHIEELFRIEERCRELRREKDLLKETQSQSFDLIKRLELHVRRLNEDRVEDKRQIQDLERELNNCHQEIDFLQDQINERNTHVDSLEDHVKSLDMKLSKLGVLEGDVVRLREELKKANSECEFLMQELEAKETELHESLLLIEKLEESVSSSALDYQCEIETMRLEMMALVQKCLESRKSEDPNQEKGNLNELLLELERRLDDAKKNVKFLEDECRVATNRLDAFEREAQLFCERVEEHFKGRFQSSLAGSSLLLSHSMDGKRGPAGTSELSSCGVILEPLLTKLLTIVHSDEVDSKGVTKTTSCQVHEYEELAKQLKEELKKEKLRSKEEAEDLAQEMAELRFQMTELLEEERKRRAFIEKASLQRISELEAQLQVEQQKLFASNRGMCDA